MLQVDWDHEITLGEFVGACGITAAVGFAVCGASYVYEKVRLRKIKKQVEKLLNEEK